MFKALILQAQHDLSDARMEFMIRDRLSRMRFLGFDLGGPTPDENTLRLFRNRLTETGTLKRVMTAFDWHLRKKGYVPMAGQIVDASLVPAPKQRNTDGEKAAIKEGKTAREIWPDEPDKAAQKGEPWEAAIGPRPMANDARWTLKVGGKLRHRPNGSALPTIAVPVFGYRSPIAIDRRFGFIRTAAVSAASAADGRMLKRRSLDFIGHLASGCPIKSKLLRFNSGRQYDLLGSDRWEGSCEMKRSVFEQPIGWSARSDEKTAAADGSIDFGKLPGVIGRQWPVVTFGVLVGALLAVAAYVATPERYTATETVLLDEQRAEMLGRISELPHALWSEARAQTEVEVIRSQELALVVVDRLGLDQDADFMDLPIGPLDRVTRALRPIVESVLDLLPDQPVGRGGTAPEAPPRAEVTSRRLAAYNLRDNLDVDRVERSFVFNIFYTDTDPVRAAEVARAVADAYSEFRIEAATGIAAARATGLLRALRFWAGRVRRQSAACRNSARRTTCR